MPGKRSRDKGKRGEREAAKFMREQMGIDAFRGRQFQGGDDSPDVKHSMRGVLVEVKRVEALQLYPALEQANEDANTDEHGIVLHRRNNKPWVLIVYADDFPAVVADYLKAVGVEVAEFDGKLF